MHSSTRRLWIPNLIQLRHRFCRVVSRCLIGWALVAPPSATAALNEYRLSFAPSSSPDAAGYTLHIGESSGEYTVEFDLGAPTASEGTIVYALDLEDTVDLFMAMRTYDATGQVSTFSNELQVSAVTQPPPSEPSPEPAPADPEPDPEMDPTPDTDPGAEPLPETPHEPDPQSSHPRRLFFDDFESYAAGEDPSGWLDTGMRNGLDEAPELFSVVETADGERVFATSSGETNIHSHYTGPSEAGDEDFGWWSYGYAGRLRIEDATGGIGVTILSDYPNSDSYLRLRRYHGHESFHLSPHGSDPSEICVGRTDTGIEPQPGAWYRFRLLALDEQGATRVRARVWHEEDAEPLEWQADCLWTAWADPAGRPGVWSMGTGWKMWDDLGAYTVETTPPGEDSVPAELVLYGNDFEALAVGSTPRDWVDTAAGNSSTVQTGLFVVSDTTGGGRSLMTRSTEVNIHSHFLGADSQSWRNYEYSGRMLGTSDGSGMGVTLYSQYPNRDTYLRLRRYAGRPEFHLANHPDSSAACVGETGTGISSQSNTWYRFRIRALAVADGIHVQGKVWPSQTTEPEDWQIDCTAPSEGPISPEGGAPGVWSMGNGEKHWDDLLVEPITSSSASPGF